MTGYHPFLARHANLGHDELARMLIQAQVPHLDSSLIGGMSRDQLLAALLDWCDSTGLARGQGDFGFIMWAHEISAGLRDRYGGGLLADRANRRDT